MYQEFHSEGDPSKQKPSKVEDVGMALIRRNNPRILNPGKRNNFFVEEFAGICATFILIVCMIFFIISLLAMTVQTNPPVIHTVLVDSEALPEFVTDPKYLSVALDSSVIADGFRTFKVKNLKLISLMSYLGPCYLRIGGTMADRLHFVPNNSLTFKTAILSEIDGGIYSYEGQYADPNLFPNFTMSGDEWTELNVLAARSSMTIIFDLNCLIRFKNGTWNSRNAEELISFSHKRKFNVMWELGNEPNSFKHVFNYVVTPEQLAEDFIKLRQILDKYPLYIKSLLVGPDVTRPKPNHKESEKYLQKFLMNCQHVLNAITWHQYYMNGRFATSSDFMNPAIFNLLQEQTERVREVVQSSGYSNTPIWLGETSSSYGGGAPGYANRYISTFIWLDKLGLAAKNGVSVVIRQSIFKGNYALLDENYDPSPDWWVSYIYNMVVGHEVVPCYTSVHPKVRLYCHCTNKDNIYNSGASITVFGVNMKDTEAKIRIEGLLPGNIKYMPTIFAYVLTPYISVLAKVVVLNDEILYVREGGEMPHLKPFIIQSASYVILPPYSSAFFIIPNTQVKACYKRVVY